MAPVLAAARDRHGARLRINAVFDQLGDRLQWAGLRQGDDGDGVPVVADLQLAACPARVFCLSVHATARCFGCFSWRGPAKATEASRGREFGATPAAQCEKSLQARLAEPTGIITISQIHRPRTDSRVRVLSAQPGSRSARAPLRPVPISHFPRSWCGAFLVL